jgi:hypothetical protein
MWLISAHDNLLLLHPLALQSAVGFSLFNSEESKTNVEPPFKQIT